MSVKLPELDDSTTFAGILIGMLVGALYAFLHIKHTGAVRRKDLTQFGAGAAEVEMQASLAEAKQQARSRLETDS